MSSSWEQRRIKLPTRLATFPLVFLSLGLATTGVPIPSSRTLWPATPPREASPQEVDVVPSTDARDSIVFAGAVAFAAAVRLITSEMPLSRNGWINVLTLSVSAVVPTVVSVSFAIASAEQRRFSWIWAQLVMFVALLSLGITIGMELEETQENVNERMENIPLRSLPWRLCRRHRFLRFPAAIFIPVVLLALLIDMEGWDVIALSFAAVVLVLLGIEPKIRRLSPVFNRITPGFPHKALAVRSMTNAKVSPLIYYVSHRGPSYTLSHEYSTYCNENLGREPAKVLLPGLIGQSLVDVSREGFTRSANTDTNTSIEESYASLQTLWPWLRPAELNALKHKKRSISILALYNPNEFGDMTKLGALCIQACARVPEEPLQSLLALCNMISVSNGDGITMHHMNQLWSQWLEVHANYSSSGLGYASLEEDNDHAQFEDTEPLLSTGSASYAASNPTEASFSVVINVAPFPGGCPELWCVSRSLPPESQQRLSQRHYASKGEQNAVAGDWLTRVINANHVDEIATNQAEWSLLLGLPVAPLNELVGEAKIIATFTEVTGHDPDEINCCPCGLIVPGPGFGLLQLICDRELDEQEEQTIQEACFSAFLARHAFDIVSWGKYGLKSTEQELESMSCLKGDERPRMVVSGELQELIFQVLMTSQHTDLLYTKIVALSMTEFQGLNDYNTSQLHGFPLQIPVACSSLGYRIAPRENEEVLYEGECKPHVRKAELRLIAPERMAVLQLGITAFFAVAALIRSL